MLDELSLNDETLLGDFIQYNVILPLVHEVEVCDGIDLPSKLAFVRLLRKFLRHRGWRLPQDDGQDAA